MTERGEEKTVEPNGALGDFRAAPFHKSPTASMHVRVTGIVRGRDIDEDATARLAGDTIAISWAAAAPWELELSSLDGVTTKPNVLTLYLDGGDLLELHATGIADSLGTAVERAAFAIPELTRGLHALGSRRGAPGPSHERWFAPLLSARRAVCAPGTPLEQVARFDAELIQAEMRRVIEEVAAIGAPQGGAFRRAVEAAIEEESEPLMHALDALGTAAEGVRSSPVDSRLVAWRHWVNSARLVFIRADESWPRCAHVLTHGP